MRPTFFTIHLTCRLLSLTTCFSVAVISNAEAQQPLYMFMQYKLDSGPIAVQTKSDLQVSLKVIPLSDMYQHPELFSFDLSTYQGGNDLGLGFSRLYPKGPLGRQWQSPLATLVGSKQALICWVKVRNGTTHILRMADARIYFVHEGNDPIAAEPSIDSLLQGASYFEQETNLYLNQQPHGLISVSRQIPPGFFGWILQSHRDSYRLINDLSREILPGATLEGMLVFPVILVSSPDPAKISFFDVVTKTDAAGNPVERAQIDFSLKPQFVGMWYDRDNMWHFQAADVTTSDQTSKPGFGGLWVGTWQDPSGRGQFGALFVTAGDSVTGTICASAGKASAVALFRGTVRDSVLVGELSTANAVYSHAEVRISNDGEGWVAHYDQILGRKTWEMNQGQLAATRHRYQEPLPATAC